MSAHERAVEWLTDRLQGVDAGYRRDVAATTHDALRRARGHQRWLELLSLAGLVVRLRSPLRSSTRPNAVWSEGLRLGALFLLTALACDAAASGPTLGGLVGAVGLAAAVALALCGWRVIAAGAVLGTAILDLLVLGLNAQAEARVTICLVGACSLIAGSRGGARHGAGSAVLIAAIAFAAFVSAVTVGPTVAKAATGLTFVWVGPCVLIGLGWLDARLAAAATTVVFARLAASGFGELSHALAVLHEGQRDLLVRWLLMGTGVVAAWAVTHRAIARQTQL